MHRTIDVGKVIGEKNVLLATALAKKLMERPSTGTLMASSDLTTIDQAWTVKEGRGLRI